MSFASSDSVAALNNFLQAHPSGNIAAHLRWIMEQTGPNNQAIHTATVMFRGIVVGEGRGITKGRAKGMAAQSALAYLLENGLPAIPGSVE